MSELTKRQTAYTIAELEKRKKRKDEGKKQADNYQYINMCRSRAIRNYKRNGRKVVIPQV